MKSVTLARGVLTTLVLLGLWGGPDGLAIERQVEEAVLSPNWPAVFTRLQADATQAGDPVARLLLGHASLATNRNNASLMLMLSVQEPEDLQRWVAWTTGLLQRYPHNAVVLYLAADAAARAGRLAEAIEGFTNAIQTQQDFALAWNARGVAHVLTNQWDKAWGDLYMATKLAPSLADAYANLGTLSVVQEVSLRQGDAALEAFNHALTLNPQFALAHNGRGCLYFGSGDFDTATAEFRLASQLSPAIVVAEINEGLAAAYAAQLRTLARLEQKPGTTLTLERRLEHQETALREQQQALTTRIPDTVIAALPHMSREQQQAVIQQYGGLENVRAAVQRQIDANQLQALKINRDSQALGRQIGALEKLQFWNEVMRTVVSTIDIVQNIREGRLFAAVAEGVKTGVETRTANHTVQVMLGALRGNPVISTVSSVSYAVEAPLKDTSAGAQVRQDHANRQVVQIALETRNLSGFLTQHLPNRGGAAAVRPPSSQDVQVRDPGTRQPATCRPCPPENVSAQHTPPSGTSRAASLPQARLSQNHPPQPRPGGVSFEELAQTFVDKGHWPVMTSFGLFYQSNPPPVAREANTK